jgi:hypothetical protein
VKGELYSSLLQDSLVKYQEPGTSIPQSQGSSVSLSSDGRVLVQGAYADNGERGSPSLLHFAAAENFRRRVFSARWFMEH